MSARRQGGKLRDDLGMQDPALIRSASSALFLKTVLFALKLLTFYAGQQRLSSHPCVCVSTVEQQ